MKLGVYAVCDGVESILDARECSLRNEVTKLSANFLMSCFDYVLQGDIRWSNCTFFQMKPVEKKREYLVKYKGLAHVHNHWITDEQLRLEGQATLTRLKKNYKVLWLT